VFLHVLGHVDAHEVVLAVEQRFGRVLAVRSCRPRSGENRKLPIGGRILDARARADSPRRRPLHRFLLADHAAVQDLVELEQLLAFALDRRVTGMPVQRDTICAISSR